MFFLIFSAVFLGQTPTAANPKVPNDSPPPASAAKATRGTSLNHVPVGVEITGKEAQGRHIVFTFDDGPNYRTTPILLDYLDQYNIKGVFYVNGRRFGGKNPISSRNRDVLLEVHRRGHYVGNHTWSHPNMASLSGPLQTKQILRNEKIIERITGYRPSLYRPPFGLMTRFSRSLLTRRGYTVVMWNLDSNDPFQRSAGKNFSNVMKDLYLYKQGMVLMHDTNAWSVESVPRIIKGVYLWNCELAARGEPVYEFATTSEFHIEQTQKVPEPTLAMLLAAKKRRDQMTAWCANLGKGVTKP
ncbi:polysaccharide deacetylase family protein [Myxococcota bacterium]|nr:polysaccharide deacetylase family protein [Myxococcota bacterium]